MDGGARNLAPPSDTASFSDRSFAIRGRPPSPPHPQFFRRQAVEPLPVIAPPGASSLTIGCQETPAITPMLRSNRMKISDAYSTTLPLLVDPFYRGFVFHSGATRNHARDSHVSVTLLRQLTPLPHNMHALFSFLAATIFCDSIDFGGSMFHSGSPMARMRPRHNGPMPSSRGGPIPVW